MTDDTACTRHGAHLSTSGHTADDCAAAGLPLAWGPSEHLTDFTSTATYAGVNYFTEREDDGRWSAVLIDATGEETYLGARFAHLSEGNAKIECAAHALRVSREAAAARPAHPSALAAVEVRGTATLTSGARVEFLITLDPDDGEPRIARWGAATAAVGATVDFTEALAAVVGGHRA